MIKFNYKFERSLVFSIRNDFIKRAMLIEADNLLKQCASQSPFWFTALKELLSLDSLTKTVFARPEKIIEIKQKYSEDLSVINERYNPELFFKNLDIDVSYLSLSMKSTKNKALIFEYKNHMLVELNFFQSIKKSYYAKYLTRDLLLANTAVLIKNELKKIYNVKKGKGDFLKKNFNKFPAWVNNFPNVFNYSTLSKNYGYSIVKSSGLSVCPFCNEEKINIVIGRNKSSRPDLDHYLPRSKYPFLSVSLYNLIPVGKRCNSHFKSDADMSEGYMNPLLNGLNDIPLFEFNYNIVSDTVDFRIKDYDDFTLNQMLFEIDDVYLTQAFKKKYKDFRYLYIYNKGLGDGTPFYLNKELMDATFNISPDKNLFNWPSKKFELDAIEDIFEDI